jgi:hypothetical protein
MVKGMFVRLLLPCRSKYCAFAEKQLKPNKVNSDRIRGKAPLSRRRFIIWDNLVNKSLYLVTKYTIIRHIK